PIKFDSCCSSSWVQICHVYFFSVRSLWSTATMYRRLAEDTELTRYALCRAIQEGALCYLHWIDNYAKFYRASSLLYNKAIQKNCLWTAHGVKVWPGDVDCATFARKKAKLCPLCRFSRTFYA